MGYIYEENLKQQGGKCFFTANWSEGRTFIREGLECGAGSCYLPMHFSWNADNGTAFYDVTGCQPLRQYCEAEQKKGGTLLRMAVRILRMLAEDELLAEDFLLGRDELCYGIEYIFISVETGRTIMAYFPQQEERRPFTERIVALLEELCENYKGRGLELLIDRLEGELQKGFWGAAEMLRLFSRWEREV